MVGRSARLSSPKGVPETRLLHHPKGREPLQRTEWLIVRAPLVLLAVCATAQSQVPQPLPLEDEQESPALLPPGIIRAEPELFGKYAWIWALSQDTQVIQYDGFLGLHLGERRLEGQDAVIWMQRTAWEGTVNYHFEVYVSGVAQVRDSAGTLTTGTALFVTFNTTLPARVNDDLHTTDHSRDTALYQEAAEIRQAIRASSELLPGADGMQVFPSDMARVTPPPKARSVVRFRAKGDSIADEESGTITLPGDVYVSQGSAKRGDLLEMRTDAAVLFLTRPTPPETDAEELDTFPTEPTAPKLEPFPKEPSIGESPDERETFGLGDGLQSRVAGVYLQGDVVLTRGERTIRASELYYDFENDRALILDAVMRAIAPGTDIPIYVRAAQVRQLSTTEYFARQAVISTSEFHTPHVHIGADRVYLTDATPRDPTGRITGLEAGHFRAHDATLNLEGVPIAYWPYAVGDFRRGETPIKSVRFAHSDDFGATFQSKWYVFNLLGIEEPEGVEGIMRLDYFSERGPGVGLDTDYELDDAYGLFRGYYINDEGEDNLGPFRSGEPDTENRGRITWRHRQFLPKGWELTLEGSYVSDPNFLEEYFNAEFEEGKEQETLLYLKKQKDNWAFTALAQWRVLDFLTQTEHLPDLGFHVIGEPIAGVASYYHESHLGFVRYKPDNRRLFNRDRAFDNDVGSDITFRGHMRNEIQVPIKLSALNLNVVPFAVARPGYWDSSPDSGSVDRLFGTVGARAASQVWRLFENVTSDLLDLNGIRHIITPEVVSWFSGSNRDSRDLYPFDAGIEDIDDTYGTSIALRQRWQTKRGRRDGDDSGEERIVDWITLDVELNLFGDAPRYELPIGRFYPSRPENSIARNHIRTDFMYRVSDTTAILADANFDLTDGDLDVGNISYAVERTPRFSYFLGYRRIHDTDSHLVGAGTNYEINSKHRLAVRGYYDIDRGKTEEVEIAIIRKFPRWHVALVFNVDQVEEDFGIGLSIWPEGAPQATIGSRRFTGLSTSTGIRPED